MSECSSVVCSATEYRQLVAAGLWQTGYNADWMHWTEGGGFSSRDLLLALGWLLATGTLEKLMTKRVQQLDKTLLTPTTVRTSRAWTLSCTCTLLIEYLYAIISLISVSGLQAIPQISHELPVDTASLRRLQWLVGCLRHQGRTLLSMQEERARLLHAVRKSPVSNLLKVEIHQFEKLSVCFPGAEEY